MQVKKKSVVLEKCPQKKFKKEPLSVPAFKWNFRPKNLKIWDQLCPLPSPPFTGLKEQTLERFQRGNLRGFLKVFPSILITQRELSGQEWHLLAFSLSLPPPVVPSLPWYARAICTLCLNDKVSPAIRCVPFNPQCYFWIEAPRKIGTN